MEATDTQEEQPASTALQEIQNAGLDHEDNVPVSQNTDEHAAVNGITDTSVEEETPTAAPSFDDQSVPQPLICEDVPLDTPIRPTSCDQAVVPSAGTVSSVTNSLEESDYGVKCPCGCNEDDGLMVFCASWNYWQHAVCFRILEENAAPEKHICSSCADPTDENLKPTDPQLIGLNQITLQAMCLWRRALLACTEMTRVLLPKLACRLGVEMAVAQGIMKRLEKEEYLNSSAKNKRLGKVVNKDLLRNIGLIKYFNQKELSPDQENLSQKFDACKKLSGGYSSQNQNKIDEIEQIAERTGVISLSGVLAKPDSPSSAVTQLSQEIEYCKPEQDVQQSPHLQAQTEQTTDKQRSGKRVHSTTDKSCEFEVSNSQDFTQGESKCRSKRKRFSVVTRPIMIKQPWLDSGVVRINMVIERIMNDSQKSFG